ncbi:hypothetical protein RAS1_38770 [Phycisphaerae bacterium RAS1]|nr:hypothetical protein RAS1_38770 [Phycisphaerae bacterium RAS1]
MILLDTNILARITNAADPQCAVCRTAIHKMLAAGKRLVVFPQSLYELWTVATRSSEAQNGLGMKVEQAAQWLSFFLRRFALLHDHPDLLARWQVLVRDHGITGSRGFGPTTLVSSPPWSATECMNC